MTIIIFLTLAGPHEVVVQCKKNVAAEILNNLVFTLIITSGDRYLQQPL